MLAFVSALNLEVDEVKQSVLTQTIELASGEASGEPEATANEPKAKLKSGLECQQKLELLFGEAASDACLSSIVEEEVQTFGACDQARC